MEEIWKDIPGFEGYQVSNLGRIKYLRWNKISINYGTKDKKGYYFISIYKNKKKFSKKIHSLVLLAFVGEPRNGQECDHIDRNPGNNKINNLRWVTKSENMLNRKNYGNSKFKGVSFCTTTYKLKDGTIKKFTQIKSQITVNGEKIHLGYFKTEEEAHEAYKQAYLNYRGYEWVG
jgi:hypothetical protein